MQKTALYNLHTELKAKIVDFHGWALPIQYQSILKEHLAVRENSGIFDCSHMGQFFLEGADTHSYIDSMISNQFLNIDIEKGVYSPLLYENGTFVDDLIAYKLSDTEALIIVNASNIEKDFAWFQQHLKNSSLNVNLRNESEQYSLLAVQGKQVANVIDQVFPDLFQSLNSFQIRQLEFQDEICYIAKTGYTGESGIEIIVKNQQAESIMRSFLDAGVQPCGLGARDSLRLEKGYSLYGNDIDDSSNALEAGLSWTVDFDKENFIGKQALLDLKQNGLKRKFIGFKMIGRNISRSGDQILNSENQVIGKVTSGVFSPLLKQGIGLAYIDRDYKEPKIQIQMNKKIGEAEVTKRCFV